MEVKQVRLLVVMMVVVIIQGCCISPNDGCLEEERNALLDIKASFNLSFDYYHYYWGKTANCCNWSRIQCNATTDRVISIDLSYARYWRLGGNWYLDASLFLPFQQLNALYLEGNGIVGCVENEGFERLSTLTNLEHLDLYGNNFSISILSSLGVLSSLRSLVLSYNSQKGMIDIEELNNLTHLEYLDIGGNEIEGFRSFQGATALPNLRQLELSEMPNAKNVILQSLTIFPNLTSIYLQDSTLQGPLLLPSELHHTTNLEEINLDGSSVDDSFLQSFASLSSLKNLSLRELQSSLPVQGLHSLKNLEKLDLSENQNLEIDSILQFLGTVICLKTLSMSYCGLNGTSVILQGICRLKHLESLDISSNNLDGSLPWCLANLTSLKILYLDNNQFVDNISSSPLTKLLSIEELSLSYNHFQIPFSLGPFFNHSKLKGIYSWGNEIYAETEVHNLIPNFQLEILSLSNHGYGGMFPKFLYHQHELEEVYFSGFQILGEFPHWLLENNTKLKILNLVNCSLVGPLQLPIHPHVNLTDLDISDNYFNCRISIKIGAYLPMLSFLNLSNNGFKGSIPSSLGNLSSLEWLHISSNNLIGNIPNSLSQCSSLKIFDGSNNHLSTLASMANMSSLKVLDLSNNMITENVPFEFLPQMIREVHFSNNKICGSFLNAFYNYTELVLLDLSHNYLTGRIPRWIDRFSQLNFLCLSHNNLIGEIPTQFCKLNKLRIIDLSHNNLSGHILPCMRSTSTLQYPQFLIYNDQVDKGVNGLFSKQPLEFTWKSFTYPYRGRILELISGIDLSSNNLVGEIPRELGNLANIKVLNLSYNYLTGPIPPTFQHLKDIESLDLSYNKLNGIIPPQLTQLYSLAVFSVAYNNLSGMTPERVAQFATFDESSYKGNSFLCGPPLPRNCNATSQSSRKPRSMTQQDKDDNSFMDTDAFYLTFGITYGVVLLGIVAVLCINPHWRREWFYLIEVSINNFYCFVVDNLRQLVKY